MASLSAGATLQNLAEILQSAAAVGSAAWDQQGARVDPNPQQPSGAALSGELHELFSTLASRSVPYLLVGGIALLKYIEGRNTDDVDLLLSLESLAKVPELKVRDRNADFAR